MSWEVKYYPEYWMGKRLSYPHVAKESPKFARSIVSGNLIFVSGCTGQDTITGTPTSDDFEEQMVMAMDKVKTAMEEAGSSLENVVKTLMLIKHRDDYPNMRRTEVDYYLKQAPALVENPPASTFIVPASLAKPEFLIEMDVIGVVKRDSPGWQMQYYPEYWAGKKLAYPHVVKESPKFARTEVVGNLVFVSGCTGQNPDNLKVEKKDIEGQTHIALDKMVNAMKEVGGSFANIAKTYVLLRDVRELPKYREIEKEYFRKYAPELLENPPASTVIQAASLALPDFRIEVEAFGAVRKDRPEWDVTFYGGSRDTVRAASIGDLLFLSGSDGTDPKTGRAKAVDIEGQVTAAFDKVKATLQASGSGLEKIVKTFMLLRRLEDYPRMRKVECEYYEKHAPDLVRNPPVSTFLQLDDLTHPDGLFEVDVTALR